MSKNNKIQQLRGIAFTFVQSILVVVVLYTIFIILYGFFISIASLFNKKAALWVNGRKGIFSKLKTAIGQGHQVIWMHCASLGEFEQGRPVLEKLKKIYPTHKILLTFFSPSGYEVRKNYTGADWIFYLPLDTPNNVARFIKITNPYLAIFVKYEYWYHYLHQLYRNQIPTILISALFRQDAVFFKWYGGLHRKMLHFFTHIFVQTHESQFRISGIINANKITYAGDTRFDRVMEIAAGFQPIKEIEDFAKGKLVIVAGSTWPDDEKNLNYLLNNSVENLFLIIAPHEISTGHIQFLKRLFPQSILYSDLKIISIQNKPVPHSKVLIIDNIGMLSKLYYYSSISYIGGGYNKSGIHNTLEAAVYGKPVLFGPNYQKFIEAVNLIKNEGGISYKDENELLEYVNSLTNNNFKLIEYGKNAGSYVRTNTGATTIIINWIRQSGSL